MMQGEHGKWHWSCCLRPALGMLLWLAGAAALALAWWAVWRRELVWGLEPLAWYWNALILGVLALGCKGHGSGHCGTCMPESK
ncbi:MAG: hypothetical protein HZB99_03460 [Candidatus Harrisonbacteria bacterium]|nr:hypothetical protein [Candidatus Harrisonbacteria bacterium]